MLVFFDGELIDDIGLGGTRHAPPVCFRNFRTSGAFGALFGNKYNENG